MGYLANAIDTAESGSFGRLQQPFNHSDTLSGHLGRYCAESLKQAFHISLQLQ